MEQHPRHEHEPGPDDLYAAVRYNTGLLQRLIRFVLMTLRTHILLIAGLTILGAGLGYAWRFFKKPVYKVSMQVIQSDLPKKTYADKLDRLNDLVKTGSTKSLSEKLHISHRLASSISDLSAENIFGLELAKDTGSKGPFLVHVELTDNSNLDSLQRSLLDFLNDVEYAIALKKNKKIIYQEKIAFLDRQIAQLDSFKANYAKTPAGNTNSLNLNVNKNDASELFKQADAMMNERQYYKGLLMSGDTIVELLDGFSVPEKPYKGVFGSILKFALAGFSLGLIIALFRSLTRES